MKPSAYYILSNNAKNLILTCDFFSYHTAPMQAMVHLLFSYILLYIAT